MALEAQITDNTQMTVAEWQQRSCYYSM